MASKTSFAMATPKKLSLGKVVCHLTFSTNGESIFDNRIFCLFERYGLGSIIE
jgi:hypothetical protein